MLITNLGFGKASLNVLDGLDHSLNLLRREDEQGKCGAKALLT